MTTQMSELVTHCAHDRREQDVAVTVGAGLSNADIAARLYLSVPMVKAHIGRLLTMLRGDQPGADRDLRA